MSEHKHVSDPVLELKNIHFGYGSRFLNGVSLTINVGEVFCLLGPSGTGKSTLLRLIAGLERCTSGSVSIGGNLVSNAHQHHPPHKRNVALVFQDYGLFPHLSVRRNVQIALLGKGWTKNEINSTVEEALSLIEMEHMGNTPCQLLSGGEQQRVALARALAVHPRLVLLDEPFSNLDTRLREDVRVKTLQLIRRYGISALLVTHDAEEARLLADRMAILENGQIQQCGTPDDLYRSPAHAGVARIIGHSNTFRLKAHNGDVITPLGKFSFSKSSGKDRTANENEASGTNGPGTGSDTGYPQDHTHEGSNLVDCIIHYGDIIIGDESIPGQLSSKPSGKITSVRHIGRETRVDCFIPFRNSEGGWQLHVRLPRRADILVGQWRKLIINPDDVRLCRSRDDATTTHQKQG